MKKMKKNQMLAMLLAALMTLSVPIVAFAEGEPTDLNTADLVQPYVVDNKAPVLKSISLSSETVNAGGTLAITVDAEDDISGVKVCQVDFVNKKTKRFLTASGMITDNKTLTLEISEYEPSGTYEIDSVLLTDNAGNDVWYEKASGGEFVDNTQSKPLTSDLSFTVINNNKSDSEAPVLKSILLSSETVNAGDTLAITVDAEDDISGVKVCQVDFVNKKTKRFLTASGMITDNKTLTLEISKYEPSGTYEIDSVLLTDNAGNDVWYERDFGGEFVDNTESRPLTFNHSFTVINDDSVPTPPAPQPTPSHPNGSTSSSASGGSVSSAKAASSSVSSSEKRAEQEYQFWQGLKTKVRKAADGKKIKVFIPKETTRMPASFMESIQTSKNNITVELHWNGKKMTITPETALKRSPRRVFWNLKTLVEQYHA